MKEFILTEVLPWLGIFLSIYLVYYAFRYQYSKKPLENQLYKVYLPMFLKLEPILYKNIHDIDNTLLNNLIREFNEIVDNHYELINPSIVHWCRLLESRMNQPDYSKDELNSLFNHLCWLIDKEFEKTRRRMFLPTRDLYYRLNNRQFQTKGQLITTSILLVLPTIIGIAVIALLTFIITNRFSELRGIIQSLLN